MPRAELSLAAAQYALRGYATPERAAGALRFFKTGPGDYGEGDCFLGVTVPDIRKVAKVFCGLGDAALVKLLGSEWHEERCLALIIGCGQVEKALSAGDKKRLRAIAALCLKHRAGINNWDLVDTAAPGIFGPALGYAFLPQMRGWAKLPPIEKAFPKKPSKNAPPATSRAPCVKVQRRSRRLWEKRIAMVTTLHFLRLGDPKPTMEIATLLLCERHDLLQKAVGWMLREMGKYCGARVLTDFLDAHASAMGRTALRYSLEHFTAKQRQGYLAR